MKTCKKICKECPFSKTSARGWLGHHTIEEIQHTMQFEGLFSCHMTRTEDSTFEDIESGKTPICRGFLASASASCKMFGQHPENGAALRELQKEITDEEKEQVLTKWDFAVHHDLNNIANGG